MNRWIEQEVRRMPDAIPVGAQALQDAAEGRALVLLRAGAAPSRSDVMAAQLPAKP